MIFRGYVDAVNLHDFRAIMEPDDGKETEIWEIDRKSVPERWLDLGAMFSIEVGADGQQRWTFECSVWSEDDVAAIKRQGAAMWEQMNGAK